MPEQEKEEEFNKQEKREISLKEERIRRICLSYYSRNDIKKAIFDFSKNRECVPRYFEGFGKRPDAFHYESDIIELVKKGATSFHSSEELWKDPLEIATGMSENELKSLRIGWDLLIDIDCKYFEYSKKAALSIIQALESCGLKNMGIKFSGGKGFHIIVPFKAFPEEVSGKKTAEMFPEWPRRICAYLKEKSRVFLEREMSNEDSKFLSKFKRGVRCETCKNISEEKEKILYVCPACKTELQNISDAFKRKRIIRCPKCQREMIEKQHTKLFVCNICNKNSQSNPENFNESVIVEDIFEVLGLDVILVSPRHLFRMPYSLHEKTSLASVVVYKDEIKDFDMIRDADPLRIIPRNFMPNSEKNEAKRLLIESLEYKIPEEASSLKTEKTYQDDSNKKFKDFQIKNINPENFPPAIKKILQGMKDDGRKRALFILLSFFKFINMPEEEIKNRLEEWNKKNYNPLHQGYIKAQMAWYAKAKQKKLPPNFDKTYYREIGIPPTDEELRLKNPVNYFIKKSLNISTKRSIKK